jgi:AcrR family transcriptional regulator
LIGAYGIHGTTVSRIATELGLSQMALYRHFANKADLLNSALQYLADRTAEWAASSSHPWIPTRLREIGEAHLQMLSADIEMWNSPMMQFMIARPAQPGVSAFFFDAYPGGERSRYRGGAREIVEGYVEEGKAQGSIRPDVDVAAFGWEWLSWAAGEDLHYLIAEPSGTFNREPHLRLLNLIIRDIEIERAGR